METLLYVMGAFALSWLAIYIWLTKSPYVPYADKSGADFSHAGLSGEEPKTAGKGLLYRCPCGGLYFENSPQEVMQRHVNHSNGGSPLRAARSATMWECLKLKLGLIR
jgi:hypothetical protein